MSNYVRNIDSGKVGLLAGPAVTFNTNGQTFAPVKVRGVRNPEMWCVDSIEETDFLHLCIAGDKCAITDGRGRYAQVTIVHIHRKFLWASVDYLGEEIIVWASNIVQYMPASQRAGDAS